MAASETILAKFIQESRELIEDSVKNFLEWEKHPGEKAIINKIFRNIHTIKGSSGLFDYKDLSEFLHTAENIMTEVRDGTLTLDGDLLDLLLECLDIVSEWISCLEEGKSFSIISITQAKQVAGKLQDICVHSEKNAQGSSSREKNFRQPNSHDIKVLARELLAKPELKEKLAAAHSAITLIHFLPDTQCFYSGEDPLYQALNTPGLIGLHLVIPEPWVKLSELDPYSCQMSFWIFSTENHDVITKYFEYVPNNIESIVFAEKYFIKDLTSSAFDSKKVDFFLKILSEQESILQNALAENKVDAHFDSVFSVLANGITSLGWKDGEIEKALEEHKNLRDGEKLRELILKVTQTLCKEGAAMAGDVKAADSTVTRLPTETLPMVEPPSKAIQSEESSKNISKVVKVSQEKIDNLLELAGELIIAKNTMPYLLKRVEQLANAKELTRDLKDFAQGIGRLADNFQNVAMQFRLLPVSQAFDRFPRLVRDISRKLEKDVNLEMTGEDTEADKTIVESLYDPLLHIIRNSLDHGIETGEERALLGKPATAHIHLQAKQEKSTLQITVRDDGRGIDPLIIKEKALKKGLVSEEAALKMSDLQLQELVFLPGFSTKEETTELSGRGVGMDVVRSMVAHCNGRLQLESLPGMGTTVSLFLPLTMAVSHVFLVSANEQLFGIPIETVLETVRIPKNNLNYIKNKATIILRNRIVPVFKLHELLGLSYQENSHEQDLLSILVIKVLGEDVGIIVDRFLEGMDAILKPLNGLLASLKVFLGTALLGDGKVLLVLNMGEVLRNASSL